jgi:hypothetical protein
MINDQTFAHLRRRTRYDHDHDILWSAAINGGFEALGWLSQELLPDLTDAEWQLILNTYSGCLLDYHRPLRIASDIMDDLGAIDINDLDADTAAVVRKCHAMSQPEQFAVLDFVSQFWAGDWSDAEDFQAIVSKITGR